MNDDAVNTPSYGPYWQRSQGRGGWLQRHWPFRVCEYRGEVWDHSRSAEPFFHARAAPPNRTDTPASGLMRDSNGPFRLAPSRQSLGWASPSASG